MKDETITPVAGTTAPSSGTVTGRYYQPTHQVLLDHATRARLLGMLEVETTAIDEHLFDTPHSQRGKRILLANELALLRRARRQLEDWKGVKS